MKENGIEIVQIPIEQHNLYMEKRNKSEEKKKKLKDKKEEKQKEKIYNEDRYYQNNKILPLYLI